ncbi:deoxyuridine 5'-triphosphate nucleotidohydrolase [bacterium]|nr:deoxyuridine 5'-triphosphate nucleotidohydrolase [bacterium]
MKLRIYKVRETAKIPIRAHASDAGMDIFYCPEHHSGWLSIKPGGSALLETGLKIGVPSGHMLQIMNKSGIASKKQLITGACVVDAGYDGEIFVNLQNIGQRPQVIEPGQKIAQAVLLPIALPDFEVIEEDLVYGAKTSRGDGALGSTGDK